LQLPLEAKDAAVNLFPVPSTQELTVGGHSRTVESQVNANDLFRWFYLWLRDVHNDMQPPCTFTAT